MDVLGCRERVLGYARKRSRPFSLSSRSRGLTGMGMIFSGFDISRLLQYQPLLEPTALGGFLLLGGGEGDAVKFLELDNRVKYL